MKSMTPHGITGLERVNQLKSFAISVILREVIGGRRWEQEAHSDVTDPK
jgi:hypothetical protein